MTTNRTSSVDRPITETLIEAAVVAGAAPSVHNTQPWLWRVGSDRLELYAERERQLTAADPDGRMMTISCGVALHHARLALAADGWRVDTARLPDPANPDLLARIVLTGQEPASDETLRMYQNIRLRHTDRRPVSRTPVPPQALETLIQVAYREGARLQVLRPDEVNELAIAVSHAASVNAGDPMIQEELARWAGGQRADNLGIPDEVIPQHQPETTVPVRDLARTGTLPIGGEHDRTAVYALLHGDTDDALGWLRGGEALSAVWLAATGLGIGAMPISEAVEMPASRQRLRRILSYIGWPYVALRLGIPDPGQPAIPRTPRLPAEKIVRLVEA